MTTDAWARLLCEAASELLRHLRCCVDVDCKHCAVLFHRLSVAEAGWFASRLA